MMRTHLIALGAGFLFGNLIWSLPPIAQCPVTESACWGSISLSFSPIPVDSFSAFPGGF